MIYKSSYWQFLDYLIFNSINCILLYIFSNYFLLNSGIPFYNSIRSNKIYTSPSCFQFSTSLWIPEHVSCFVILMKGKYVKTQRVENYFPFTSALLIGGLSYISSPIKSIKIYLDSFRFMRHINAAYCAFILRWYLVLHYRFFKQVCYQMFSKLFGKLWTKCKASRSSIYW